jgi:hypothetical protein
MTRLLVVALVAGSAACAQAQSLMTLPPNNGSGGVFMDLTAAGAPLTIDSFATYFSSAAGTPVAVEVWTRAGTYVGFDASNAGWTLMETAIATSSGTAALSAAFGLANPIAIGAGQTQAVYLHATTTGGGIRYQGTTAAPSVSNFANADLSLFSDVARTGVVPFAGSRFTPRAFAGEVNYTVIPAPGALALMGLGGLVAVRRRR